MRFPQRAILRCRQLSIPVCGGVAPKDSSAASIPAIAFHGCHGLPQQRDGSLGERRHERLCLVVVVLRSGQCQRRHVELQFRQREPVEQREPRYRACRALRPASAWGCFLSSCFRAAGPQPDASARRAEGRTICSGGRIWNCCLLGERTARERQRPAADYKQGSVSIIRAGMQPFPVVMAPLSQQNLQSEKIAGFVVKARPPETPMNVCSLGVRSGAFHERLPGGRQQPHRRNPLF